MNKNISSKFPFYYGWVIVTVSLITLTVIYGIWWSFPAFYVNILHEFGWSRGGTATIFTVGSVVYGFGSLAAGALVDKFGPKRTYSTLLAAGSVPCFMFAFATSFEQLALARFLSGFIGAGFVIGIRMVGEWFPARQVRSA